MKFRTVYRRSCFFFVLTMIFVSATHSQAQESELADEPTPRSVREIEDPLARGWLGFRKRHSRVPRLVELLDYEQPFLADSVLVLKARTYYFNRDREEDWRSRAWAIGGSLEYRSGWWNDALSIGAELYDSEKLYGKEDEFGSGLLQPVQEGYTALGQAYLHLKGGDHHAVLYRQELNLPYVNKHDIRMTPNTFEAYMVSGSAEAGKYAESIEYVAGYVAKMKPRTDEEFSNMADVIGITGVNRGLVTGGLRIQPSEDLALGGFDHYVDDIINIAYASADYTHDLTDEIGLRLEGQFTHQGSMGSDLLAGHSFNTWNMGGRLAASYKGWVVKTALATTDSEEKIRNPYGSFPGYISLMQKDFNRAGEDAWLVAVSYDFEDWGLNGFSAFANYAVGRNAYDVSDGMALPDQQEFDITADYRIAEGWAGGLWFRVRWSKVDFEGVADHSDDFRVIVNYELPLL